ncbi:MAG: GNAT family N-acetyltransferase [Burkholderiales bacterium RIFCSPLOWO2_02_FULL_57_36]|nr:MAG: GNAT family N-acetyltransferase [Burkholderiales bacterium RIFCSPLOWO2_02_FULL_57_36]
MQIELQHVEDHDCESLVTLRIATMRESLERIGRFDPQRARDRFLDSFSADQTKHIVLNGARIGFVIVKQIDGDLLLDHLYIDPDHQSSGVGTWVLGHIFKQADGRGLPVRVGALKGSDSNRFYTRHGFRIVEEGEWDNYYVRIPHTPFNTSIKTSLSTSPSERG